MTRRMCDATMLHCMRMKMLHHDPKALTYEAMMPRIKLMFFAPTNTAI